MPEIKLQSLLHEFTKVNQVSHKDGSDTWKCIKCGIKGKRPMLADYTIVKGDSDKNKYCNTSKSKNLLANKRIKIIYCIGVGTEFKNVTPDSIHYTVPPPKDYYDDCKGVWIEGESEPVKVLIGEFMFLPLKRTKK